MIETYNDCKQNQDPRWFSVSHAYMDENANVDHLHHRRSRNGHVDRYDHHECDRSEDDLEFANTSHHHNHHSHQGKSTSHVEFDREPAFVEEDDEEDEAEVAPKSVGLISLFRYSNKLDLVLMLFGGLGAFINGGSLPWYSFLFGKFVNKLALGQNQDKHEMMKEVDKVSIYMCVQFFCLFTFCNQLISYLDHLQICLLMTGLAVLVTLGAYLGTKMLSSL